MPIRIGLTGGIGSGKSTVAHLLEVMGIPVYISDLQAHRLTHTSMDIRHELVRLLGSDIYRDGRLNKPLLATYLFADDQHLQAVNRIIHPRVRTDFRRWVRQHAALPVVGMESAILLEAGFAGEVDRIVAVYAPTEVRIRRIIERDHLTAAQVEQRLHRQWDDEQKCRHAHFVLLNDGRTPLIPQLLNLLAMLPGNVPRTALPYPAFGPATSFTNQIKTSC
ncbi:MAG: dephospho-CoA kinase [Prevotellaceae bacterium]|jgi:dephospho-CoA kinase|nr:dephospho-CoA kinase [Prevotellaceae bacterium]